MLDITLAGPLHRPAACNQPLLVCSSRLARLPAVHACGPVWCLCLIPLHACQLLLCSLPHQAGQPDHAGHEAHGGRLHARRAAPARRRRRPGLAQLVREVAHMCADAMTVLAALPIGYHCRLAAASSVACSWERSPLLMASDCAAHTMCAGVGSWRWTLRTASRSCTTT